MGVDRGGPLAQFDLLLDRCGDFADGRGRFEFGGHTGRYAENGEGLIFLAPFLGCSFVSVWQRLITYVWILGPDGRQRFELLEFPYYAVGPQCRPN